LINIVKRAINLSATTDLFAIVSYVLATKSHN